MNITFNINELYNINSIEDLDISERASNCLHRANVHIVGDLVQMIENNTLNNIKGLGKKVEKEVKNALFNYELCHADDVVKFLLDCKVA